MLQGLFVFQMLMLVVVFERLSMIDIWTISLLVYLNDVLTICHLSCPKIEFIYSVVTIEQFMMRDHCCNQNYNFINTIRIVDYSFIKLCHKVMQLSNIPWWLMITLCCAIVQTQWLKRLSGSWAICTGISFYNAFDCQLMQHLLYTAIPVIAIQTFLILGAIMILLVQGVWINIIAILQLLYFLVQLHLFHYCTYGVLLSS